MPSSFSCIAMQRNRRRRSVGSFSPHTPPSITPSGRLLRTTLFLSGCDTTVALSDSPLCPMKLIAAAVFPAPGNSISLSSVSERATTSTATIRPPIEAPA
ncbi:hypothetical protein EOI87_28545 [Salmonella enterica]|nr:hypothetical protein [Salmonella enterica]